MAAAGLGLAEWDFAADRHHTSALWQEWIGQSGGTASGTSGSSSGNSDAPSAVDWLGWLAYAPALDRTRVSEALQTLRDNPRHTHCTLTLKLRGRQGEWRDLRLQAQVVRRDLKGRAQQMLATLQDLTAQRSGEERERMAIALFEHLQEGLLVTDTQHRVLDANPGYCLMMGVERKNLLQTAAAPLHPDVLRASGFAPVDVSQAIETQGHWQGRITLLGADQRARRLQVTVAPILEAEGPSRLHIITVAEAFDAGNALADPGAPFASDALTGLPNAQAFLQGLERALPQARQEGFMLGVCCLDLDQFARLNESLGQQRADRLLNETAQRLRGALRADAAWSDQIARLGGDDFALLLRCRSEQEARQAIERLLSVLQQPIGFDDAQGLAQSLTLSAGAGVTLYPQDASDAEALLRHAVQALHEAKNTGRNSLHFFDAEQGLRQRNQVHVVQRLRTAMQNGELCLHYQPKVDLRRRRVLGMEALLRWLHPERGLLAPAEFLPEIEGTALAADLGDWVFERALEQTAAWLAAGMTLNVSVNVSAVHLQAETFVPRLLALLAQYPAELVQHLTLELLESAAMSDLDHGQALMQQLHDAGLRFALDDFGTGYTNLAYLKRLPIEVLKVDRSFVQNLLVDERDAAIVEGIVALARSFGCQVVAEGVESDAHAQALLELGCTEGQGSGIALAMPAADVATWVADYEAAPEANAGIQAVRLIG